MKKVLSVLLLFCLMAGMLFATENREFRATWSRTWDQYSSSLGAEALKARTDAILDKHVEAGMNAVLWHVRQGGTVYYPSAIEPWGPYLGYSDPGYDPLEYAIKEAHKRGLEVHVWFNTFHCSSTHTGAPAEEHPEWVCRDGDGNPMGSSKSLSPGLKDVRDYTINLVVEIVSNYDIDGIHFDYVRWNEYDNTEAGIMFAKQAEELELGDGEYTPEMQSYFEDRDRKEHENSLNKSTVNTASNKYLFDIEHPESGGIPDSTDLYPNATPGVKFASWGDWRRGATSVFVKAAHDTVQQIKPWVKVSPAALGRYKEASWNGYYSVFQDAAKWFNEGWIDLLTPMCYHWYSGSTMKSHLISDWQSNLSGGRSVGRPFSVGPGSYLMENNWSAHKSIVDACRTLDWVKGFQFYSYGEWKYSIFPTESSHSVFAYLSKHPEYAFLNATVPPTPSVAIVPQSGNDSLYTLNITPDPSISDDQWFVIYRSNDSNIDVNSDEIIQIVFADSAFSLQEYFNGLQKNAGRYYYGVTQCSRYWVESPVSNIVSTADLPSDLPIIVVNDPVDGAVNVPNNKVVEINFNKSMDAASVEANLTISPEPVNKVISWDNPSWVKDDHLVLYISASWAFDTEYTITVGGSTLDQAGLNLDANVDGTAGDDYTFSFTISSADSEPPVISFAYPDEGESMVDTDLPVTLIFNERLNTSTLAGKFLFQYTDLEIEPSYTVFTGSDDLTYINVKPASYFPASSSITLQMLAGIADTAGNEMGAESITFETDSTHYVRRKLVDYFLSENAWWGATNSGSTSGLNGSGSTTNIQSTNRVSGFAPDYKALKIVLDPVSDTWFARIHNPDLKNNSNIDTSMNMQAYVYGDGSGYKFRFSLAERSGANLFEVSPWFTVDWIGWKLVEWDISDTKNFGDWGGMTGKTLDGTSYGLESLQFASGDIDPQHTVTCYVDQIRTVDKLEGPYPENHRPTIEAIADTTVKPATSVYYYAEYSDPDPSDALTLFVIPDTSAVSIRHYSSPANKVRLKAASDYTGACDVLFVIKDNGIGELSDTAKFTFNVSMNPAVVDVPESFKLHANYPNPFNPVTTLRFDLPKADNVKVEIFNTVGRLVSVLTDRYMEAGSWEVNFDASFLSSGVYLYKVTAGTDVAVDKMTLLK